MLSRISAVLATLAAVDVVSGQTFTKCNPMKQDCPADPAFGANKVTCDFTKGACDAFKALDGTVIEYGGQGAVFKMQKETEAPTIETTKYLFFGRVDVVVQAAPGAGIVTSSVLQSDDLDEIDWEWIGSDNGRVQSNYFSKGDTSTYDRGDFHGVSNPTGSVHTYSLEWKRDSISWIIDGKTVRTLNAKDAKGGAGFPQTPMQVKLGTWVAGRHDANPGTVQWAGGHADFSKGPVQAFYKSITIVDYAGGDGPGKAAKEYVYGDKSGSAQSIQVKT